MPEKKNLHYMARKTTANEQGLALLGDLKNVRPEPLLMLC